MISNGARSTSAAVVPTARSRRKAAWTSRTAAARRTSSASLTEFRTSWTSISAAAKPA
ncbi:hypothetical protein [Streptomyces sp. NPDC047070]|uniref:hypothetical protein n=1 Tax=Streptomyces sp. NPDC047070 TaxID=3154923 RepID=UPI0034538AE3